jgi:DNA repair photolyase
LVKVNAIDLLRDELSRKRVKGVIGLGSMNDPFMPLERESNLAGRALEVIAEFGFPVHIITKSDLILKDLETLKRIAQVYASISFTLTTTDDDLAARIEPGAPRPSARLAAMRTLAENDVQTGTTMMPILPFIEDNEENIEAIVVKTAEAGGSYIIPGLGMTTRNRQREYYYNRLDEHYPGLREQYIRTFGDRYECHSPRERLLWPFFQQCCRRYGIPSRIPLYAPQTAAQLSLFESV